jgi:hypothetical protein
MPVGLLEGAIENFFKKAKVASAEGAADPLVETNPQA